MNTANNVQKKTASPTSQIFIPPIVESTLVTATIAKSPIPEPTIVEAIIADPKPETKDELCNNLPDKVTEEKIEDKDTNNESSKNLEIEFVRYIKICAKLQTFTSFFLHLYIRT